MKINRRTAIGGVAAVSAAGIVLGSRTLFNETPDSILKQLFPGRTFSAEVHQKFGKIIGGYGQFDTLDRPARDMFATLIVRATNVLQTTDEIVEWVQSPDPYESGCVNPVARFLDG